MGGMQHRGAWVVAIATWLATLAASAGPAAAQRTIVEADASASLGYTQFSQKPIVSDPNALPEDVPDDTTTQLFTQLRPGLALQTGTPRVSWRAGYLFGANFSLSSDRLRSYSHEANAQMAAELSKVTTLTIAGTVAQGASSFLLAQKSADKGVPEIRRTGNPDLISASVLQSLGWAAGKHLTLRQGLTGSVSGPQDDFGERNAAWTLTLGLDRAFERDTLGAEVRASVSWLRALRTDEHLYHSVTNAIAGRWNHDFSVGWNGLVTAGVEQVYTDTGSEPLAFTPAGSATVRYAAYNAIGAVSFSHGTATNLQVGSISLTDQVTVSGIFTLDPRVSRALSFSAGFLHNEPLGESDERIAAGTGNAVQADAGFTTAISRNIIASARYSLSYQFDQFRLNPALAHIFFLGVTGIYRNTEKPTRALPARGQRVDGADGEGFPSVSDRPSL